jgi:uncharacterized membrane protein
VPLFANLDDDERRTLAAAVEEVTLPAQQYLFRRGEPGGALYLLLDGEVELSNVDATGRKIVLEKVEGGGFFGELSLLDGRARSTDALVLLTARALRVDRDDLLALFGRHPEASLEVLAVMGRRLREADRLLRYRPWTTPNEEVERRATTVERLADGLAAASGSFAFLVVHAVLFFGWIVLNLSLVPGVQAFDPYPFGLLTMSVSLEAIFLSCFVLISQRRQAAKDRIRSDAEYEANIKAGLEVSQLHVKVDNLFETVLARISALDGKRS